MQNELNELRHQVRTLKRVVYGAFGLMLVGGLLAATSMQSVPSVMTINHKIELSNARQIYPFKIETTNTSRNTNTNIGF